MALEKRFHRYSLMLDDAARTKALSLAADQSTTFSGIIRQLILAAWREHADEATKSVAG